VPCTRAISDFASPIAGLLRSGLISNEFPPSGRTNTSSVRTRSANQPAATQQQSRQLALVGVLLPQPALQLGARDEQLRTTGAGRSAWVVGASARGRLASLCWLIRTQDLTRRFCWLRRGRARARRRIGFTPRLALGKALLQAGFRAFVGILKAHGLLSYRHRWCNRLRASRMFLMSFLFLDFSTPPASRTSHASCPTQYICACFLLY
jgi:hypothetical protein